MPWCRIGGTVVQVDSAEDCRGSGGTSVPGPVDAGGADAGTKKGPVDGICFIRSVLTRGLGELILDMGVTEQISVQLVRNVDIPRQPAPQGRAARGRFFTMTPTRRVRLANRVLRSILKLAATYQTGLEFRVSVFLATPRGRQILEYYHRDLPEIYEIARNDYTLLNDLASAWLQVYPFVTAMVSVATAADGGPQEARRHSLSAESYEQGQDLIRRFGEASSDHGFRSLTRELAAELGEYRGLDAEQAVAKLRSSPARRHAGAGA